MLMRYLPIHRKVACIAFLPMKSASVLAAFAALLLAPLATAQTCNTPANRDLLFNLAITSSVKRTTVTGGNRIVQTISVRNNNARIAAGLAVSSAYTGADNQYVKGAAKVPGTGRITMNRVGATNVISTGATTFSIPAGKTLKATLTWTAVRCPPAAANTFPWGPARVSIPADTNAGCFVASIPAPTATVRRCASTDPFPFA